MMSRHRAFQLFGCALAMTLASAVAPALAQGTRPNVVFILADNVGYGDMGPYGGGELRGMPTPRVDQLAREGLRLTQFFVESSCTPSRAALMTGQYSIRNGLSLISSPGGPNQLSAKAYTMGPLFKDAGYATALFAQALGGLELGSTPSRQKMSARQPEASLGNATRLSSTEMRP
jgi:arylsulfatase A-like enzyme